MIRKLRILRRRVKNTILLGITFIACLMWTVCGACLDSDKWVPFFIGVIISELWIMVFAYANSRE